MKIETIVDYTEIIKGELARFDTVFMVLNAIEGQVEEIENVIPDKLKNDLESNFRQLKHLIWAADNLIEYYLLIIKNITESED